jgi:transmembrane protein DUF3566
MAQTTDNPITREAMPVPEAPPQAATPEDSSQAPFDVDERGELETGRPDGYRRGRGPKPSPRRTRVTIRRVGVFSVFKFSLLFYFCAMLILFFALLLIWTIMRASGTIDTIECNVGRLLQPAGTTISIKDECVPYEIVGAVVFTWAFLIGCVGTVVLAALNTFVSVIYNLVSDIVGGIEVTLSEKRPGAEAGSAPPD